MPRDHVFLRITFPLLHHPVPSVNPVLTISLPSTDLQLGLTRPALARQHDTLALYDSFDSMFPPRIIITQSKQTIQPPRLRTACIPSSS